MRGRCSDFTPRTRERDCQRNLDVSVEHVPPPFRHEPGDSAGARNRASQRLRSDYNLKKAPKERPFPEQATAPAVFADQHERRPDAEVAEQRHAGRLNPLRDYHTDGACNIARPGPVA